MTTPAAAPPAADRPLIPYDSNPYSTPPEWWGRWKLSDLRHQRGGQIRIWCEPYHVANVLASGPDPMAVAEFIVAACTAFRRPPAAEPAPPPPPAEGLGLAEAARVELWDAINRYTVACRGDPSRHVYGNTPRMRAVADVEAIFRRALDAEEALAKDRREAAEAWAAGRTRGYQLTPQEIETIGRWAAAESGSTP